MWSEMITVCLKNARSTTNQLRKSGMVSGFPIQTLAKPDVRSKVIILKQTYKLTERRSLFPSLCSVFLSLTRKSLYSIKTEQLLTLESW